MSAQDDQDADEIIQGKMKVARFMEALPPHLLTEEVHALVVCMVTHETRMADNMRELRKLGVFAALEAEDSLCAASSLPVHKLWRRKGLAKRTA